MKILLDECVDWRLSRHIAGHEIKSAREMGWASLKNGALLAAASSQFDAFVTVDRNLSFQQNTSAHLVLRARTNRLADLMPLVPTLLLALTSASAGIVTIVNGSAPKD